MNGWDLQNNHTQDENDSFTGLVVLNCLGHTESLSQACYVCQSSLLAKEGFAVRKMASDCFHSMENWSGFQRGIAW
jgi:hypothetical protein